ncbi:hypothetical protein GSI_11275 [Ganoderma sinense ZZ0214-1]|uniref:BTB domain-containing protein n=1 Tax=Ganoderma sinense ZZ0214-1 TaxID=1077348 RepID=A0A2G8RYQ9_9APHY|nr:hypothetical protein GSI_11275 [Ganoderma sinense ZZ0214-1]
MAEDSMCPGAIPTSGSRKDGNVVVVADSTSFRIHHSVLARHSNLLADRLRSSSQAGTATTATEIRIPRATGAGVPPSASRTRQVPRSFKALLSLLCPGPSDASASTHLNLNLVRQVASARVLRLARGTQGHNYRYLHGLLPTTY